MRLHSTLFLVGSVLIVPGCALLNPGCIYQTRIIETAGSAAVSGGGSITVESLFFREHTHEAQTPPLISWNIRGEDLPAAPIRLTLRDSRNPGQIVKSLSFTQTFPTGFMSRSTLDLPPNEADQMFSLVNGNAIVVLELTNGSSTTVPLGVTELRDWHRLRCD